MLEVATAGAGAAVSEAMDGDKAMTADEAARQIDRGLMLWEQHPRAREVRCERRYLKEHAPPFECSRCFINGSTPTE